MVSCVDSLKLRLFGFIDNACKKLIKHIRKNDNKIEPSSYDFKMYDYYRSEIDRHTPISKFRFSIRSLNGSLGNEFIPEYTEKRMIKLCKKGKMAGAFKYFIDNNEYWVCPNESIVKLLKSKYTVVTGKDKQLCKENRNIGAFIFDDIILAPKNKLKKAKIMQQKKAE